MSVEKSVSEKGGISETTTLSELKSRIATELPRLKSKDFLLERIETEVKRIDYHQKLFDRYIAQDLYRRAWTILSPSYRLGDALRRVWQVDRLSKLAFSLLRTPYDHQPESADKFIRILNGDGFNDIHYKWQVGLAKALWEDILLARWFYFRSPENQGAMFDPKTLVDIWNMKKEDKETLRIEMKNDPQHFGG